jgi:GDP-4-dehydro-6-deoxy-D-mannose reductase
MTSNGLACTLVTGDTGFVGQHALASIKGAVGLSTLVARADVRDKSTLVDCLRVLKPSAVLHLAALSFVPDSFKAPELTYEVNFLGTLRLLEALAEIDFRGRFVFVGTGDAYGVVPPDVLPVVETHALRPRNPYAVSKAAAEALCFQWSQTGPFEVLMARPFNHIGPGQSPTFAVSDFARQIAEIAAGKRSPVLSTGNIDVTRDFTDVRDVVRAYELMLERGRNGEIYNVCSGTEQSLRGMIKRLLSLSKASVELIKDATRSRPTEQMRMCGSHQKLTNHTGWTPQISVDAMLRDIYQYWEKELDK